MYKPNFCAQCGLKVLRLKSRFWSSRKFCDKCARALWRERFTPGLVALVVLTGAGYIAGRAHTPLPPPLTIIRRADSPLTSPEDPGPTKIAVNETRTISESVDEQVYLCGAATKKGTPCSRRVHGPVRCWQHKGARAMLAQEKLLIKE